MVRLNHMVIALCVMTSMLHIYLYTTRHMHVPAPPAATITTPEAPPTPPERRRKRDERRHAADEKRPEKRRTADEARAFLRERAQRERLKGPRSQLDELPPRLGQKRPDAAARSPQERAASEGIGRASKWDRRVAYSPRPPKNATFHDWLPAFEAVCGPPSPSDDDVGPVTITDETTTTLDRDVLARVRDFDRYQKGKRRRLLQADPRATTLDPSAPFRLPVGCAPLHTRSFLAAYTNTRDDDRAGDDAAADDDRGRYCDAATCLPNMFLIGASKSGTTTLYEALRAHPRVLEMFAEPHTNGETHVFTEPRPERELALRAVRRSLPLKRRKLFALQPRPGDVDGRWHLDESRDGPTYVVEYTPHYLVLPEVRSWICGALRVAGADCGRAKFVAMLRDPAKRAFSQWVMKTHMRVPIYNDRRSFWDAAQAGMRHTGNYAKCWDKALGLEPSDAADRRKMRRNWDKLQTRAYKNATARRAGDVVVDDAPRVLELAAGDCQPKRFHNNLFQAYVLKSAYYYQLLPWFAGQGRHSLHVLTLEGFDATALQRLLVFAGLKFVGDGAYKSLAQVEGLVSAQRNVARDGGTGKIEDEHRALLDDYFRPMNRKLDALLAPVLGRPTGYPV